jgi:hypothetical protein
MLAHCGKKTPTETMRAISLLMALLCSIVFYLILYITKGESYQTWKVLSFLALPLSFALFGALAVLFEAATKQQYALRTLLYAGVAACGIAHAVFVARMFQAADVFNMESIRNAKEIASNLKKSGVLNVVLATPAYRETMLLFPYLTQAFQVFPLSQSYVYPSEQDQLPCLDSPRTMVITAQSTNQAGNTVISFKQQKWKDLDTNTYAFAKQSNNTLEISNEKGLSGPEMWGRWTDGKEANFDITKLPYYLRNKELMLQLEFVPFGTQNAVIAADGNIAELHELKEPTIVSINLSQSQLSDGRISVNIDVANPLSPQSLDPTSADTRQLGLGLIKATLKTAIPSSQ